MVKSSRAEPNTEADRKEIHPWSPSLTYHISQYFRGYPEVFLDKMRCVVLCVVLVLPLGSTVFLWDSEEEATEPDYKPLHVRSQNNPNYPVMMTCTNADLAL